MLALQLETRSRASFRARLTRTARNSNPTVANCTCTCTDPTLDTGVQFPCLRTCSCTCTCTDPTVASCVRARTAATPAHLSVRRNFDLRRPQELRPPSSAHCRDAQLVSIDGRCCREWVCPHTHSLVGPDDNFRKRHRRLFAVHLIYMFIHRLRGNVEELECGPMPNVMAALPNIGGALCSTPQSLADAHY